MQKNLRVFVLMMILMIICCPGVFAKAEEEEQTALSSLMLSYPQEVATGFLNTLKARIDEGDYTNEELDNLVDNTAIEAGIQLDPAQKKAVYDFAKNWRGFTWHNFFHDFSVGYTEAVSRVQQFVYGGGLEAWWSGFKEKTQNAVGGLTN